MANLIEVKNLITSFFTADGELRARHALTSANSINVGRWLPQAIYYFHAWSQLPRRGTPLLFGVPSGNFGNLAAGLLAKRLGLPVDRFVAATNANDVVPEYLRTGTLHTRASVRTISSAMDVGNPSNLARLLYLCGNDLDRLRGEVTGSAYSDDETRDCITRVHEQHGYLLDPHSAVGYLGLLEQLEDRPEAVGVLLATAHPAKFAETVEPLIGEPVPVPEALTVLGSKTPSPISIEPSLSALEALLEP